MKVARYTVLYTIVNSIGSLSILNSITIIATALNYFKAISSYIIVV